MKKIQIREASISEMIAVADMVPELGATPREDAYRETIGDKPQLFLLAEVDGKPAGFKVGYELDGFCSAGCILIFAAWELQGL
jgi:ribosomal protein S18 acetylase RimI-like enzyme